jgi:SAM-dependent methyltransferase
MASSRNANGRFADKRHALSRMRPIESIAPHADVASPRAPVPWDLERLARARRLGDWMFDQYAGAVRGRVAEIGAGIGTFSERILAHGVDRLLMVESNAACADRLRERLHDDSRAEVVEEELPLSPTLASYAGRLDLVVCQNVLEHVPDDRAAVQTMADGLRPGGQLTILVPGHPRLYGSLDEAYGHRRRYTRRELGRLAGQAGLEVRETYAFNLLGIPGWWVQNRRSARGIGARSLSVYESLLTAWRPVEDRMRLPWGLSVVLHAIRPPATLAFPHAP